jgi:hypothetical protein
MLTFALLLARRNRLKIAGKHALTASLVIAGKAPIWIYPAITPLLVLAALEPIGLAQAVAFEVVSATWFGDATCKAGF